MTTTITRIMRTMACVAALVTLAPQPRFVGGTSSVGASSARTQLAKARVVAPTPTATFSNLPAMSGPSEALAINEAGTVIVGSSWQRDVWHAMKWTLQNGTWTGISLPRAPTANSAIARGVNNNGDAAGNDFPGPTAHAVLWPSAGAFTILGCNAAVLPETVYAMATGAQVVVGAIGNVSRTPAVWRPGGACRQSLPVLAAGGSGAAYAVNGDGTVVGGFATGVMAGDTYFPMRWQMVLGSWLIEQLDSRPGNAMGANATGDLVGSAEVPCASEGGCRRAVIWYAGGGSRDLGTLGGKDSWARDINSTGEVVGASTSPTAGNTAYFWSDSRGMIQLPFKGRWAAANALSNVRPDGTRVVVGTDSSGNAVVWVVRNP
jgi:probable HAF family extracellular repeat protein